MPQEYTDRRIRIDRETWIRYSDVMDFDENDGDIVVRVRDGRRLRVAGPFEGHVAFMLRRLVRHGG